MKRDPVLQFHQKRIASSFWRTNNLKIPRKLFQEKRTIYPKVFSSPPCRGWGLRRFDLQLNFESNFTFFIEGELQDKTLKEQIAYLYLNIHEKWFKIKWYYILCFPSKFSKIIASSLVAKTIVNFYDLSTFAIQGQKVFIPRNFQVFWRLCSTNL